MFGLGRRDLEVERRLARLESRPQRAMETVVEPVFVEPEPLPPGRWGDGFGRVATRSLQIIIVLLLVVTTTGMIGIGPAVVLHEGSTLAVILNALRLLTFSRGSEI